MVRLPYNIDSISDREVQYLVLPNSLIFLGIDFILPKCRSALISLLFVQC